MPCSVGEPLHGLVFHAMEKEGCSSYNFFCGLFFCYLCCNCVTVSVGLTFFHSALHLPPPLHHQHPNTSANRTGFFTVASSIYSNNNLGTATGDGLGWAGSDSLVVAGWLFFSKSSNFHEIEFQFGFRWLLGGIESAACCLSLYLCVVRGRGVGDTFCPNFSVNSGFNTTENFEQKVGAGFAHLYR